MFLETIGYLGTTLLMICWLPQLIKTVRYRKFDGLSITTLFMALLGAFLAGVYTFLTGPRIPILLDYIISCIVSTTILVIYFTTPKK